MTIARVCVCTQPRALPAAEYAQALHTVLVGLETGMYSAAKLLPLSLGYLALVLFAVLLSTSLMRLPIVQYSSDVLGTSQVRC